MKLLTQKFAKIIYFYDQDTWLVKVYHEFSSYNLHLYLNRKACSNTD